MRYGIANSPALYRPAVISDRAASDIKHHVRVELYHNACSSFPPSGAAIDDLQPRTVGIHHTESSCGGRMADGLGRPANIPTLPTDVRQRHTGFLPA